MTSFHVSHQWRYPFAEQRPWHQHGIANNRMQGNRASLGIGRQFASQAVLIDQEHKAIMPWHGNRLDVTAYGGLQRGKARP